MCVSNDIWRTAQMPYDLQIQFGICRTVPHKVTATPDPAPALSGWGSLSLLLLQSDAPRWTSCHTELGNGRKNNNSPVHKILRKLHTNLNYTLWKKMFICIFVLTKPHICIRKKSQLPSWSTSHTNPSHSAWNAKVVSVPHFLNTSNTS